MPGPLSPRSAASYNQKTATSIDDRLGLKSPRPAIERPLKIEIPDKASTISDGPPSSPFQTDVGQENRIPHELDSPRKSSPSKRKSPAKAFNVHEDTFDFDLDLDVTLQSRPSNNSPEDVAAIPAAAPQSPMRPVMESVSNEPSVPLDDEEFEDDALTVASDDTCFSTFSAVPNADMTLFANIMGNHTTPRMESPARSRDQLFNKQSPHSPSPHRQSTSRSRDDTTNLLLDFTQQFDGFRKPARPSPTKRGVSPVKNNSDSNPLSYIHNQRMPSPSKTTGPLTPGANRMMNLLDFDLPPQPTPRSVPSITARELETLKSSYLSEISSLKASLSGREAEVESLKKAVNDAERRVGEALEAIREERNAREHAEKEKGEWEKKGTEVESVLRSVKEEFMNTEKEREELLQKLDDSSRLREDAEMRIAELVTKSKVVRERLDRAGHDQEGMPSDELVQERVAQQLDEKMENLARELHSVYKKKHESKVATLKRTYELRSEKKCQDLQQKFDQLTLQHEQLQASNGSNSTLDDLGSSSATDRSQLDQHKAELSAHKGRIAVLTEQMENLSQTHAQLLHELESERAEKGDLVAAVDEMLALQLDSSRSDAAPTGTPKVIEEFRKSMAGGRPSGLRAPGGIGGESRIGRGGAMAAGLGRTPSAGKSRMMSNIERMGLGNVRGGE